MENSPIHRGSKVFVSGSSMSLPTVLQLAHTAGQEGIQKTLQRLRRDFLVDKDRVVACDFVRSCVTCQQNKTEDLHPAGLMQPLEVPPQVWTNISLDFSRVFQR